MKFQCEICSAMFDNADECSLHEIKCRKHHESLLNISEEINALIGAAECQKINLGVEIPVQAEGKSQTVFYAVKNAIFRIDRNRIIINIKPNESKSDETKNQVKSGNKK